MSLISAQEEQIFREIAARFREHDNPHTSLADRARARLEAYRRPTLVTIWLMSLLGVFGMVGGTSAIVACAVSLTAATAAIMADFTADPDSWTHQAR